MPSPSRLLRWLLRLYPSRYRERYGREMEAFHKADRIAGKGGPSYWLGVVMDHVSSAWSVRRAGWDRRLRSLVADFRMAGRTLVRAPSFTFLAVLTLGLGIGATTGVFSVLDRVALRPLPYPGGERMVLVGTAGRGNPTSVGPLSGPLMERLRENLGPSEAVAGASSTGVILEDGGEPERARATRVTRGFFELFGARAEIGRLLADGDYDAGAAKTVVLGYGVWRERYGGDPEVLGRTLRLNEELYTVIGVIARDFVPPPEVVEDRDLWVPLQADDLDRIGSFFLAGVSRLRPGATLATMEEHVDQVMEEVYPELPTFLSGGVVTDYRERVSGDLASRVGRVLAAVALLLIIACTNVASLVLTRNTQRARELGVRVALGAGRVRLMRHLLAESLLVACGGAALGAATAWGSVELFRRFAPPGLPRLDELAVDGRGLAFSFALGIATVLLFGLLPALRSTATATPAGGSLVRRSTGTRRERRVRGTLVAVETTLAVVLAVGASLFTHDLLRLAREDPGFELEGLLAARLDLSPRFERQEWNGVWRELLEGAEALPGVSAAVVATQAPYAGTRMASMYRPEGYDDSEGELIIRMSVLGDYVRTLGARVVEGRAFTSQDAGSRPVVLVNEAFVRRYWPGEPGVGKYVRSGGRGIDDEPVYEVVGVLGDVRTRPGSEAPPTVMAPLEESPAPDMELIVRSDRDLDALVSAVRGLVRRIDPGLPVTRISTAEALGSQGRLRARFYTGLFTAFALMALVLAVVGVYGTTAYATRARKREIGIRMALGAGRRRVIGAVVAGTGMAVGAGIVLGLGAAALASRAIADVLLYVTPRDILTYLAVASLVAGSGLLAAWVPAHRAGHVDPMDTLRHEG